MEMLFPLKLANPLALGRSFPPTPPDALLTALGWAQSSVLPVMASPGPILPAGLLCSWTAKSLQALPSWRKAAGGVIGWQMWILGDHTHLTLCRPYAWTGVLQGDTWWETVALSCWVIKSGEGQGCPYQG